MLMPFNETTLGIDTLESVDEYIKVYLDSEIDEISIAKSLLGTNKGILLITKEFGKHYDSLNDDERIAIFMEYIYDNFTRYV
jgi:hypothetical protein